MSSSAAHPSTLVLHRLHLSALPAEEAHRVQAHVAACGQCRHDLDALAADHRQFDRVIFPGTSQAIGRHRRWRWAVPAALATAAVMLWLIPRRETAPDIATKGTKPIATAAMGAAVAKAL